jgi:PKHD-type hydroxylase
MFNVQHFNKAWVDMVHKIAEAYPDEKGELYQYSNNVEDNNNKLKRVNENYLQRWIPTDKHKQLLDHFNKIVFKANKEMFGYNIWLNVDHLQYTTYDSSMNSEFPTHIDSVLYGRPSTQKLTVVVGLTDKGSYEGGAFEINLSNNPIQYKLTAGQVLVFPSMLSHRVTPVTKGIRQTLVTWYSGPMWR